jgi:RNA polymerase sigma-70 factor (ECF subfamily)
MESLPLTDDNEIFLLVAEGEKTAFKELFRKYTILLGPFIFRIAKSDRIADELIQETFMRIWFKREKLQSLKDPQGWIFRTAAGVCQSFLQQLLADEKVINIVHHEFYFGDNQVLEKARLFKLAADIQKAIKRLNPDQKTIYRLSREKGLKVPDIADQLEVSPNKVRNVLNSSMEFVDAYLHKKGHRY